MNLKASWAKYGCLIMMNGWSDMKKQNIINILVSFYKCIVFLNAIDASTHLFGTFIQLLISIVALNKP